MPRAELAVFDLDGTLVDTLRSIAEAMNAVLRDEGLPTHPTDAYRRFAGDGAEWLVKRATGHRFNDDPATISRLLLAFRGRDEKTDLEFARPYDGVPDLLDSLEQAGTRVAVFSNKERAEALALVDRLFGLDRFAAVEGHDGRIPLKPDPTGLHEIMARAGVSRSRTVYIGDTDTDMRTGRAAGVFTIGCAWGFRDESELQATGADAIAARPSDVAPLVRELPA